MLDVDNEPVAAPPEELRCKFNVYDVLSPISLPCGRELPNRLVKAATYEHLAPLFGGPPSWAHFVLYGKWGLGEWGMVTTGNVQVSPAHLTLGCDLVIPQRVTQDVLKRYALLASFMKGRPPRLQNSAPQSRFGEGGGSTEEVEGGRRRASPLAIMQLSHAGRQSTNIVGGRWPFQRPLAPSATRVGEQSVQDESLFKRVIYWVMFQKARTMTVADIKETVDAFVRGAKVAEQSGFDGIQLHAAHGYLISQFISRKTNHRTDAFGYPLAFLRTIVFSIRKCVRKDFVLGLKLNVADYLNDGFTEEDARSQLSQIISWNKVDYIEISGGNYEAPEFTRRASTRQAFFESFSRIAVQMVEDIAANASTSSPPGSSCDAKRPPPLIMLTGGLRTRTQFVRALSQHHAHLLGLAREAALHPELPHALYECRRSEVSDRDSESGNSAGTVHQDDHRGNGHAKCDWTWEAFPPPEPKSPAWWPRIVGAGVGIAWYNLVMRRLAEGRLSSPHPSDSIRSNPRLPSSHWLVVVLDVYLEPIAEYAFSRFPYHSRSTSSSSVTLSFGRDSQNVIPVFITLLSSVYFCLIFLRYVCGYPTFPMLWVGMRWYMPLMFLASVWIVFVELIVLRKWWRLIRNLG